MKQIETAEVERGRVEAAERDAAELRQRLEVTEHDTAELRQRLEATERDGLIATTMAWLAQQPVLDDVAVSVVTPTHKRPEPLREAIGSVMAQCHQTWEMLVVTTAVTRRPTSWRRASSATAWRAN